MKKVLILLLFPLLCASQTYKAGITAYNTALSIDTANLCQGLEWNESSDTYQRCGSLKGYARNASPGNSALPIQSRMRGCVLNDAGRVVYYLNADNWDSTAGNTALAVLTGADGQVMVEIPKFYYYYEYSGTTHKWKISPYKLKGFSVHPAFIKDGVEVNYRYIGAYEGVLYDVSGSAYTDGNSSQVKDWTNDKLSSVSGKFAVTNGTRAQFRTIAKNRGAGWRQMDYDLFNALQLLMLIEYGTFYIQNIAEVGPGITNVANWPAYNNYYPIAPSGNGNAIGSASGDNAGSTVAATEAGKYSKYRGIENFYGHLWKFVDGININNGKVYVTNTLVSWVDDTSTGYTDTGMTFATSSDYQKTLVQSGRVLGPATVGGASNTYITDYYWYNSGWRVLLAGGRSDNGTDAGACSLNAIDGSGIAYQTVGARVAF
jgi:predicted heme/steroid binding protein